MEVFPSLRELYILWLPKDWQAHCVLSGKDVMGMANFQRIPHKERMRQLRYRHEHEENLEEARMCKLVKELEKAKCSNESYEADKEREFMDELRRLGLLERRTDA